MKILLKKIAASTLLALGLAASGLATAQTAICYNCPPEWADWASQLKAIKAKTGITVPPDNKNSGQSLAQLVAEKAAPTIFIWVKADSYNSACAWVAFNC